MIIQVSLGADYLIYTQRFLKIVILKIIFFSFFSVSIGKTDDIWDFQKYRNPNQIEYTEEEQNLIRNANQMAYQLGLPGCNAIMAVEFKLYNDRYPKYKTLWNEDERLRRWRKHLVRDDTGWSSICPEAVLTNKIWSYEEDIRNDTAFYFCGRFSREAWSARERKIKADIEEYIDLAVWDRYFILTGFMINNENSTNNLINLNQDVEYFFRRLRKAIDPEDEEFRNIDHLIPKLSKDRIAFLDDAVKRSDYQAVVDTTPPCPAREDKFKKKKDL